MLAPLAKKTRLLRICTRRKRPMHRILLSVIKYFVKSKEKRYKKLETTPWAIPTTGQNPCLGHLQVAHPRI